jgi:16S rRNA (cytidine1402-2'-O)-methyltransferase
MSLFVIATPIGNMGDITVRAIDTLGSVEVLLCEDTRVTGKLLQNLGIEKKPRLLRYDEHVHHGVFSEIVTLLEQDKRIGLVCDAGTPGVSDPGAYLVDQIRKQYPHIPITPIPGVSAITTAVSIGGITDNWQFVGFVPHKKGRETFFNTICNINDQAVIFYESIHRLSKTLHTLAKLVPNRKVAVARELTKLHEQYQCGSTTMVAEYFDQYPEKVKGECVLILYPVAQSDVSH